MKKSKTSEIAMEINLHLKRMEADPEQNQAQGTLKRFYQARCYADGPWVNVQYTALHGFIHLKKVEGEKYLAWLSAGNRGKHWQVPL